MSLLVIIQQEYEIKSQDHTLLAEFPATGPAGPAI